MNSGIKLYDMELSGNCYKIRLFCGLLGLEYQSIAIDLRLGQHREPDFLKLNPRAQIPVLDDNGTIIWDSSAILVYLAQKYADPVWLPIAALPNLMQWLAVSENELLYGLARARAVKLFNRPWNLVECQALGVVGLTVLERHLQHQNWLVGEKPTIADIACYPYVALAHQGDIDLDEQPGIQNWLVRIKVLSGFVSMPGIRI
jgi:glutathione S-transferase